MITEREWRTLQRWLIYEGGACTLDQLKSLGALTPDQIVATRKVVHERVLEVMREIRRAARQRQGKTARKR